ncbi:hypothetical protein [Streptomyces formicae]|uniref:Lipoprotein n=1 Tax=Streptomyces formicae TaxID=1616117 RepID=A0A291QET4_9ACTN|nr:hypothetical protein [Streptomyces formicae]ATL30221.1 hypothetical protein KY5_5203c [Streptomyces formicae]
MRIPRPFLALLLTGALSASAAACSLPGGDDGDGDDGTGLEQALDAVPASASDQAVTYRDVRTTRRLVAADPALYRGLAGYGILEVVQHGYTGGNVRADWGFDAKDVRASVQVGDGSLLTGRFDTDAVARAMKKRGYRATDADGGTRYKKSGDATTYEVSDSTRVSIRSDVKLGLAEPDKSLLDEDAYAEIADCLGDVYEATYYAEREDADAVLFAIGGRLGKGGASSSSSASSSEKLCARTASKRAAESIAARLREKTAPGERYAGSKVTVGEGGTPLVTMTWKNSAKSGLRPGDNDKTGELPGLLIWGRKQG